MAPGHSPLIRYAECPSCLRPYRKGDLLTHALDSGHTELTRHLNKHLDLVPSCHWCAMEPLEEDDTP